MHVKQSTATEANASKSRLSKLNESKSHKALQRFCQYIQKTFKAQKMIKAVRSGCSDSRPYLGAASDAELYKSNEGKHHISSR